MDDLINLIKEKIKVCAESISSTSANQLDLNEAQAIEHLSRAMSYLTQINERILKEEPITTPTIPEMRATIRDYCRDRACRNCVINNLPNHRTSHCYELATDAEVIENYNAIKNEIKEDK